MRILHIVPGLGDPTNGISVAAKLIASRQSADIIDVHDIQSGNRTIEQYSEVWVHSMWLPRTLLDCWRVLRAGVPLVRMPHGCMDPVKVRYHLWKKIWFLPIEWWLFRRAKRIVSTEDDEDRWIAGWHTGTEIERVDLFGDVKYNPRPGLGNRKFLFVGRMHPLKGVDVLIEAVRSMKASGRLPDDFHLTIIGKDEKGMRAGFESAAQRLPVTFLGQVEEDVKRRELAASDCLILPTLSENFGLIVKEALELGVPVITTDGAKYWKGKPGVTYIEGYLAASYTARIQLLKDALEKSINQDNRFWRRSANPSDATERQHPRTGAAVGCEVSRVGRSTVYNRTPSAEARFTGLTVAVTPKDLTSLTQGADLFDPKTLSL